MSKTMMRVVKNKDNPYMTLNTTSLKDPNLSAKSKGIHCYLLSLPDDWKIYVEELQKHFTDGRDSISGGIIELINSGYIQRNQIQDEQGRFQGYEYLVFEVPQDIPEEKKIPKRKRKKSEKPLPIDVSTGYGFSENGSPGIGKAEATKYLSKLNTDKKTTTKAVVSIPPEKLKEYSERVTATLGAPVSDKSLIALLSKPSGEEQIDFVLSSWEQFKSGLSMRSVSGTFVAAVKERWQPPKKSSTKAPQCGNYDQRQYSDDFFESLYTNL